MVMKVDNLLQFLLTFSFAMNMASSSFLDRKLYPADYKVSGLSKFGLVDETYAGYLPIHKHIQFAATTEPDDGSLFFWFIKKRTEPNETKRKGKENIVIWLNGGPGCSSMVGMMLENGPFTISFGANDSSVGSSGEKYDLKYNPFSWSNISNVLYVEQPIRTGYSIASKGSSLIRTEKQVASDFRGFLLSFQEVFSDYSTADLFITGESYAGAYIPSIADHIIRVQEDLNSTLPPLTMNLEGIAIGNGVIDSMFQEPSYAEYAYTHGLIPLGAKKKFDADWVQCLENIERSEKPVTRGSFSSCRLMSKVLDAAGRPNEYNTATFVSYDRLYKKGSPFDTFFQDPEVQTALHVRGYNLPGINVLPEDVDWTGTEDNFFYYPPKGWQVCNNAINDEMTADHPTSMVPYLQHISTHGVRVLLYSGEFDLNCNTLGTLHTLEAHRWRNKPWDRAARSLWVFNGEAAGEYFTMDNMFSFLIVRNSGHLLPMDIPATAMEMLRRFLFQLPFATVPLPSEASYIEQMERLPKFEDNTISNTHVQESGLKSSHGKPSVLVVSLASGIWGFVMLFSGALLVLSLVVALCKYRSESKKRLSMFSLAGKNGYQSLSSEGEDYNTSNTVGGGSDADIELRAMHLQQAIKPEHFIGLHVQQSPPPPSPSRRSSDLSNRPPLPSRGARR